MSPTASSPRTKVISTLIVYAELPERVSVYMVNLTEKEFEFLSKADGKYINGHKYTPSMHAINIACSSVCKDDKQSIKQSEEMGVNHTKWAGFLFNRKVDNSEKEVYVMDKSVRVIQTGFIL